MNIEPVTKEAYQLIHDGVLAFTRAELAGMRVDLDYCHRKIRQLSRKEEKLQAELMKSKFIRRWRHTYGRGFNLNSDPQLAKMLYEVEGIEPPKLTDSGKGAVDEETLTLIGMPELQTLVQIRKIQKLRGTYLEGFLREQVDGFIHPFLNLHTVRTYRSSSDSPNLQNVPKRDGFSLKTVRKALYARKGHQLLEVDFSGLEVSIAATYHKDPTMMKYLTTPGTDMHGDMAMQIFVLDSFDKSVKELKHLRGAAKNGFVFPEFYGDYYANCAVNLACKWCQLPREGKWKPDMGVPLPGGEPLATHLIRQGIKSFRDFEEHIREIEDDFWNHRFAAYGKWRKDWVRQYQRKGYFTMHTGFRCSGVMTKNEVINYPVQGAAFHCLLWSFIQIDRIMREEGWDSRLVNQIHDALILDVHPDELEHVTRTVRRVTCVDLPKAWKWIIVPLDVEADLCGVDESWADKEGYKLPEVA